MSKPTYKARRCTNDSGGTTTFTLWLSVNNSSLWSALPWRETIHDFFGDAMTAAGYSSRLRAAFHNILLELAKDMRCE